MTRSRIARFALVPALTVAALIAWPAVALAAEGGLAIIPDWGETFALVALFIVFILPANALIFRPLLAVFDERERKIEGAQARAKHVGEEANRVLGQYEYAVREARKEAEGDRREALDVARKEQSRVTSEARGFAEQEVTRAREGLAQSLESARADLRSQAEDLAREAAASVLGRRLS